MLTNRQKYDYTDIDYRELKLIRVGHALWSLLRRERRQIGYPLRESGALYEAIGIIVRLKREKRAELKAQRAAESAKVRERFAARIPA